MARGSNAIYSYVDPGTGQQAYSATPPSGVNFAAVAATPELKAAVAAAPTPVSAYTNVVLPAAIQSVQAQQQSPAAIQAAQNFVASNPDSTATAYAKQQIAQAQTAQPTGTPNTGSFTVDANGDIKKVAESQGNYLKSIGVSGVTKYIENLAQTQYSGYITKTNRDMLIANGSASNPDIAKAIQESIKVENDLLVAAQGQNYMPSGDYVNAGVRDAALKNGQITQAQYDSYVAADNKAKEYLNTGKIPEGFIAPTQGSKGTSTASVVSGGGTPTPTPTNPPTPASSFSTKDLEEWGKGFKGDILGSVKNQFGTEWQDGLKNNILSGVDEKNKKFGTEATAGFMDAFKNFAIPTGQKNGVNLGNYNDNRNASADQWWSQYITGRR